MTDLKPDMLRALSGVNACVCRAYSQNIADLPIAALRDYGGRVIAQAGGAPCLEEQFYALDIYALTAQETDALAHAADGALTDLGLRRVFQADLYDEGARAYRKSLRYRAVIKDGAVIYQ